MNKQRHRPASLSLDAEKVAYWHFRLNRFPTRGQASNLYVDIGGEKFPLLFIAQASPVFSVVR
jgi:hypothetical protein